MELNGMQKFYGTISSVWGKSTTFFVMCQIREFHLLINNVCVRFVG